MQSFNVVGFNTDGTIIWSACVINRLLVITSTFYFVRLFCYNISVANYDDDRLLQVQFSGNQVVDRVYQVVKRDVCVGMVNDGK